MQLWKESFQFEPTEMNLYRKAFFCPIPTQILMILVSVFFITFSKSAMSLMVAVINSKSKFKIKYFALEKLQCFSLNF